jgi:hypothetical protein
MGYMDKNSRRTVYPAHDIHNYAVVEFFDLLERVGRRWRALHPLIEYPPVPRIQIGDFSLINGGETDQHGSHENGLDVDIRYMRSDGQEAPVEITDDGHFSRSLSQELITLFCNYSDRVDLIFVGDEVFTGCGLDYTKMSRHQDHFHLRIVDPDGESN